MKTRRSSFGAGVTAVSVMLPGVAPFGMIVGVTAAASDVSTAQAIVLSMTVFAGASQLAMLQLINEAAIPAVVLLTALTINLRFVMYSASLAPHVQHLGPGWRTPLAFFLVDQNYALGLRRYEAGGEDEKHFGHWYYLGISLALWVTWQASTLVGLLLGTGVPREWSLDFAIPLVFLVLLIPALHERPHIAAALTGGLVATVAAPLPFNLGIVLGAAAGIAAGLLYERHGPARAGAEVGE